MDMKQGDIFFPRWDNKYIVSATSAVMEMALNNMAAGCVGKVCIYHPRSKMLSVGNKDVTLASPLGRHTRKSVVRGADAMSSCRYQAPNVLYVISGWPWTNGSVFHDILLDYFCLNKQICISLSGLNVLAVKWLWYFSELTFFYHLFKSMLLFLWLCTPADPT